VLRLRHGRRRLRLFWLHRAESRTCRQIRVQLCVRLLTAAEESETQVFCSPPLDAPLVVPVRAVAGEGELRLYHSGPMLMRAHKPSDAQCPTSPLS
jgi:hypothetical protein